MQKIVQYMRMLCLGFIDLNRTVSADLVSVSTIKFHGSSNMTKTIDLEPLYEIMNEIETMFTIIHQNSTLT